MKQTASKENGMSPQIARTFAATLVALALGAGSAQAATPSSILTAATQLNTPTSSTLPTQQPSNTSSILAAAAANTAASTQNAALLKAAAAAKSTTTSSMFLHF